MSEQVEDLLQVVDSCDLRDEFITMLDENCSALVTMYSGDAVFAAQKVHIYVFEPIWDNLSDEFFSSQWENELTNNETAIKLTKMLVSYIHEIFF